MAIFENRNMAIPGHVLTLTLRIDFYFKSKTYNKLKAGKPNGVEG